MTKGKLMQDFKSYCQKNNHTTHAPSCTSFFKAMPYTSGVLQKMDVLWSELVEGCNMKLKSRAFKGRRVRPYRRKGLDKAKNVVQSKCGCGRMYDTEVDFKGSRLNRRCNTCKQIEGQADDYSGNMGEALYNIVPEDIRIKERI